MKKLLIVLLSLGLIAAFSMTASAADVKFGGQYYLVGMYDNNPMLEDEGFSEAHIWQRLRIKPVFKIADGLTLTTQFDALEKGWGDSRWRRNGSRGNDGTSSRPSQGYSLVGAQENIEFEQGYMTFNTKVGQVQIGYQTGNVWGTAFGNAPTTMPRAQIMSKFGNVAVWAIFEKYYDGFINDFGKADTDNESYALAGVYKAKGTEGGLLLKYYNNKTGRLASNAYTSKTYLVSPYAKMTFGPVYVEGQVYYLFGKAREYEAAGQTDIDEQSLTAYINGKVNMGPASVGAFFAYIKGNDYSTDKSTGDLYGGYGWNPAMMLMNGDAKNWSGAGMSSSLNPKTYIFGRSGSNGLSDMKKNTIWYGITGSYKATPKLSFETALTYATVETKKLSATREAESDKLGMEFDVSATYKIYDNLSYMVGAGYLWAGDYFKLDNPHATVANNYLLLNKLTLSF